MPSTIGISLVGGVAHTNFHPHGVFTVPQPTYQACIKLGVTHMWAIGPVHMGSHIPRPLMSSSPIMEAKSQLLSLKSPLKYC
jgi:hypothetical protein